MDLPVLLPSPLAKLITVSGESALAIESRLQAALDAVPVVLGSPWAVVGYYADGSGAGGRWLACVSIEQIPELPPPSFPPIPLLQRVYTQGNAGIVPVLFTPPGPFAPFLLVSAGITVMGIETVKILATAELDFVSPASATPIVFELFVDGVPIPGTLALESVFTHGPIAIQVELSGLLAGPHSVDLVVYPGTVPPLAVPTTYFFAHRVVEILAYGPPESPAVPAPIVVFVPGARVWAVEGEGQIEAGTPQPGGVALPLAPLSIANLLQARIEASLPLDTIAAVQMRPAGANAGHRFLALAIGNLLGRIG